MIRAKQIPITDDACFWEGEANGVSARFWSRNPDIDVFVKPICGVDWVGVEMVTEDGKSLARSIQLRHP